MKMKKLHLEKLKLAAEDVLQRNQMTMIYGGSEYGNCLITCVGPNGDSHQHPVPACSVGCIQGAGYEMERCVCT